MDGAPRPRPRAVSRPVGGSGGPERWLRFAPGTYFSIEDCVVLQATGVSPQSYGGERSPGGESTSSMGSAAPAARVVAGPRRALAPPERPDPPPPSPPAPSKSAAASLVRYQPEPLRAGLLHEAREALARGCAYCTNARTPRSTPPSSSSPRPSCSTRRQASPTGQAPRDGAGRCDQRNWASSHTNAIYVTLW